MPPAPRPSPSRGPGGDRCPGALRLHPAADGHLARVRLPGGRLTASGLEQLVTACVELGDASLHLTSRGNVQLRGLAPDAGHGLADRLWAAGLLPSPARDRVRNIVASPLAGVDGRGHADADAVVVALDRLLCSSPGLGELSGRFLFAVDDGRGDVAALGADVAAVGLPGGSFRLWVGGRPTARTASASGAARLLAEAALRFLASARGSGAWRVAELPATLEPDAPPASVPELAPAALGLVQRGGHPVGVHARPRLGSATAQQWTVVADLALAARGLEQPVRLTPWRTVVLAGLDADRCHAALRVLREHGFETDGSSPWARLSACAGRPGCASALADVRADAPHVGTRAVQAAPTAYLVHLSGCERRCGRPPGAHVEVLASGEGRYSTTIVGDDATPTAEAPTTTAARPPQVRPPRQRTDPWTTSGTAR